MYAGRDFDPAEQGESEPFGFDFTRDLLAGESITGANWALTVEVGLDPDPQSHAVGPAAWAGVLTSQRLSGLLPGVRYRVEATVSTNLNNTASLYAFVVGVP